MKMQWMKEILGDAYTDEMDEKFCQIIGISTHASMKGWFPFLSIA